MYKIEYFVSLIYNKVTTRADLKKDIIIKKRTLNSTRLAIYWVENFEFITC